MPRSADLVYGVNQRVLVEGLECDVEINRGASRRGAKTLPVGWDDIPGVLDTHIIPMWRYRRRQACGKDHDGEGGEHRPPVMAHHCR